ncbi:tyrosine-protein phosphatase [Mycolicibacillus trivialis]|uniref:Phosphotyrosine protein phosphatase n=1 Tax=Mycolicibacillus trivialis TaxID=1798 RepID=A0A1X2EF95_9MYCO|nr:tyrosine-protein phosphatase [Mycolicibacillus trivialis]ORX00050.1 phosphotyrosine protein phosphatase [Mycolicibacillus trivialis]
MPEALRRVDGTWNFRDVADTVAGLRPGRLLRSGELSQLADSGRAELSRLAVTDVADLRSPREVERRGPGRVPDGVDVHLLPFPDLGATDGEAPHEQAWQEMMARKPDDEPVEAAARRYMIEEYRRFPLLGGAQRAVRTVITLLGSGQTVLAHCFAGKDRTGFTVAVTLAAIGVDRDAIVGDYLQSNAAVPALRDEILAAVRQRAEETGEVTPEVQTFTEARLTDEVLGVRDEYLGAAYHTIDAEFGSVAGFLRAARVDPADVDRLRAALLG